MLPNNTSDDVATKLHVFRDGSNTLLVLPTRDDVVRLKRINESQAAVDPRLVTAKHLSHFDLLQPIVMN